ncbi:uncharacterized protein DUF2795 [Prauserella shujinwangii]|uniref:Uncharacterized protein DUF2795 n=1 Tax=Prauserella shujinwangii TaxID=1453103 RepID=A0A2T0LX87_9PSEU|nr:DUF2795 domain-containing protein [Prauserella shujinwangii]PRX48636.1 uncharacterized protein DUF2795 [Prauserella shujinwangii]
MATTDVERLRTALSDADFPAQKDDLVRDAEQAGADGDTIRALNSIPPVEYASLDEVEQSVPFDPGPPDAETGERRRRHAKPGLSQQEKDVPEHPIVEELGENRGS